MDTLQYLVALLVILSVLVSFFTQITKESSLLKRIPTKMQVLVTSFVLTVPAVATFILVNGWTSQWYTWFCLIVAAPLVVAKCASDGYDWIFELHERFRE